MMGTLMQPMPLVEALSSEVVRKLRLASEAENKEDREIVCEEVFCDVTGRLDESAQVQLGAPDHVPFYVVLARHYATPKGADSAVVVLHLLQNLYGQGYAAPLVALLLHRWLLLRRAPGRGLPEEQRTRVANAMALGSAQLFMGDVHGGAMAFEPLWHCLTHEVVLGERTAQWGSEIHPTPSAVPTLQSPTGAGNGLSSLSLTARTAVLAVTAAFLVYYTPTEDLGYVLKCFPSPTALPAPSLPASTTTLSTPHDTSAPLDSSSDEPASSVTESEVLEPPRTPPLVSPPYHGVDFVMMEVVDVLGKISTEAGLVRYLRALQRLRGQPALTHEDGMRLNTRLKLQSTLSAMAAPGGPRYYPYAVGVQALETLDSLFPQGTASRRLVRAMFRLLHPADWIGDVLAVPLRWLRAFFGSLVLTAFRFLHSLVLWGAQGGAPERESSPTAGVEMREPTGVRVGVATAVAGAVPPSPHRAGVDEGYKGVLQIPSMTAGVPDNVFRRRSSPRRQPSPQVLAALTPRTSLDKSTPRGGATAGPGSLQQDQGREGDVVVVGGEAEEPGDLAMEGSWVVPEPVHAADVQSLVEPPPVEGQGTGPGEGGGGGGGGMQSHAQQAVTDAAGPGTGWLAAGAERRQQLLDHARSAVESTRSAVGNTVTAVESGVKAMASRLKVRRESRDSVKTVVVGDTQTMAEGQEQMLDKPAGPRTVADSIDK